MVQGHTDPTCLGMCARTQPTALSASHVTAMYGPATNMPLIMPHKQISSHAHDSTM